jgi:hypothetical protein
MLKPVCHFFLRMSKSVRETFRIKILAGMARAVCAWLTLAMWTLILFSVHFVCTLKSGKVQQFLEERDIHLSEESLGDVRRALLFLPALIVTLVKLVTPTVAKIFERWEHYPFTTKVAVYSGRLFFARCRFGGRKLFGHCFYSTKHFERSFI